jgi:hypothetical protein
MTSAKFRRTCGELHLTPVFSHTYENAVTIENAVSNDAMLFAASNGEFDYAVLVTNDEYNVNAFCEHANVSPQHRKIVGDAFNAYMLIHATPHR